MMNRAANKRAVWLWIVSVVILGANSLICFADSIPQNSRQSKVKDLKEVVVTSEMRKVIPEGFAYFPTRQEKKFANDAMTLLEQMNIPELNYNPLTKGVESFDGQTISFFIDGRPASSQQLSGLLPKNVDRVEYLQSPASAQYQGAVNVVNFVMKKYVAGGYTKLSALQSFHNEKGKYSLASKFEHKSLTLDAFLGGGFSNEYAIGSVAEKNLSGISYKGVSYDKVSLASAFSAGRERLRDLSAALQLSGMKNKSLYSATAGWNWNYMPEKSEEVATEYTPDIVGSDSYFSSALNRSVNPYLRMDLTQFLPKSQTLSVSVSADYLSGFSTSVYSPESLGEFCNSNKEKLALMSLRATYSKRLNSKNSIMVYALGSYQLDKIDYAGSYGGQSIFREGTLVAFARYTHTFKPGTVINLQAGFSEQWSDIEGNRKSPLYPRFDINFSHKWNKTSSFRISTNLNNVGFPGGLRSRAIVRQSELFWRRGNPDLKNRLVWSNNITNTWNLSRSLSVTAYGSHTAYFRDNVNAWYVVPGYDGLVSNYINSDFHQSTLGANASWYLFKRKLLLRGNVTMNYANMTGEYSCSRTFVSGWIDAVWYIRNCFVRATYIAPTSGLRKIVRYHNPAKFTLYFGYSWKDLKINAWIENPFRSSKMESRQWFEAPNYSESNVTYRASASRFVNISLVYTFDYGKKVNRTDFSAGGGAASGALDY